MANEELMDISIEKYDIQNHWINDIATKYMDVSNINHLKVGLFGYLNEVMATEIRYDVAHRNFLYDETFLNTASMTKSIYNKAKSYNYEISQAFPASCVIVFSLKQSDIIKYGEKEVDDKGFYTGNYKFKLSSDTKFMMDEFEFRPETDIVIMATKVDRDKYSYTSRYDFSKCKDNKGRFSGINNPYIATWVDRDSKLGDIISIRINIYQYTKNITRYENFSNDLSDNLVFDTKFVNNLCGFDMDYTYAGKTKTINGYFNDSFTPEDEEYFYYSFDINTLTTYFSGLPSEFKPAINSKLDLNIYTTLGTKCNFSYEGIINCIFESKYSYMEYGVNLLSDPVGGKDMPTKKEIKQDLIYEFLTRDNLITEFDLNNYFNKIIKSNIVNSSEILFIKKRDDVLKRSYSAFILFKDKNNFVIPTNTIDMDLFIKTNKDHTVYAGSSIVYDDNSYILYKTVEGLTKAKEIIEENTGKELVCDNYYYFVGYEDNVYIPYNKDYDSFKNKLIIENTGESLIINKGFYKIFNNRDITGDGHTLCEYIVVDEIAKELIVNKEGFDETFINMYDYGDPNIYIKYDSKWDDIKDQLTIEKLRDRTTKENDTDSLDNYNIRYILPFSMYYLSGGVQRIMLVKNSIDSVVDFNYEYINANIPAEFIISSLGIKRDSINFLKTENIKEELNKETGELTVTTITSNGLVRTLNVKKYDFNKKLIYNKDKAYEYIDDIHDYSLSFTLDSTYDKDLITGNTSKGIYKEVICRAIIIDEYGNNSGYFDFDCSEVDKKIYFTKKLKTNDEIDLDKHLILTDCIQNLNESYDNTDGISYIGDTYQRYLLDEKSKLHIYFLVKDDKYEPVLPKPLNLMKDLEGYTVACKFESINNFSLFKIMNDLVNPVLTYKPTYNVYDNENLIPTEGAITQGGINIGGIPVVGEHYFNNYDVYKEFFTIFEDYYEILKSNFDKLENNTSVEIKFYNTYGFSKHWTSYSTDIKLDLEIKISENYTTDLDLKIKKTIINFVESINKSSTKVFAISNLIKLLEKTFQDIQYIELNSVDGLDVQKIYKEYPEISNMTKKQLINYIPEYLNIHIFAEAYEKGDSNFLTGITIKYK